MTSTSINTPTTAVVPTFIYARHRGDTAPPPTPEPVLSEEKLEPAASAPIPAAIDFAADLNLYRDPASALTLEPLSSPATSAHDDTAPLKPINHTDFHMQRPPALRPTNAPAIPNNIALLAPGLTATWNYTHHKLAPETSV